MSFLLLALSQLSHPVTDSLKCFEREDLCGSCRILGSQIPTLAVPLFILFLYLPVVC